MKALRIIVFIYTVVVTCFFITFSFYSDDLNDTTRRKPVHFETKIYPTYYDEDLHKEWLWPFIISKNYKDSDICVWNEPKKVKNIIFHGFGEEGAAFVPSDDMKELMEQLHKEHNFNLLASDMISLHRTLPDPRYDECKILSYPEKLPTTSVIIIFHNEAWTTLLRTVWSVIDRSPFEIIKEIILVDDMSTLEFLKRPLDDYIENIPANIKLIRTSKREGLIRSRLIGAEHATGNILTFLDAHIECCEGWLQPLLARIASDRSVIAVPLIDNISSSNMSYRYIRDETFINGFRWSLIFDRMPVPERERIRTQNDKTAPIRTPTMIGCAFSMDREFFYEIGSYDEGMNIWGSENMEMSLRVWQCGGSMEIIPCSHVGHLFRMSTYSYNGNKQEIQSHNSIRLVEVWMSDFKELYYAANPVNKKYSGGNFTERIQLKERLKCKNFRWYLDNIYPESTMSMEFIDIGAIQSVTKRKCIDVYIGFVNSPLQIYSCHGEGGNQVFAFAKNQMIVTGCSLCVGVKTNTHSVISVKCTDADSHLWKYDNETQWLVHTSSGLCMQVDKKNLILGECDPANYNLKWNIISSL